MTLGVALLLSLSAPGATAEPWSDGEIRVIESLALPKRVRPTADPSNRWSTDKRAQKFGKALFFAETLSGNGELSCASCHQPDQHYSDGLETGYGVAATGRNTPSLIGVGRQTWFYWDGRSDSLWSQALIPFEAPEEMGSSRLSVAREIGNAPRFRKQYEALFGAFPAQILMNTLPRHASPLGDDRARRAWQKLPEQTRDTINRVATNIGKAIAAFERTLVPKRTLFDKFAARLRKSPKRAARLLTPDQLAGARLFIDSEKTQCMQCHNGPIFTNGGFHNIGTGNFSGDRLDFGRVYGLKRVLTSEFNCFGPYSDAAREQCKHLLYLDQSSHTPREGAFKTPSLRGVRHTAPYFHDGRFDSLDAVLAYYNDPPSPEALGVAHELRPMNLSEQELQQLRAFLEIL